MDPVSPTRRRLIAATAAGMLATRLPHCALARDATPAPSDVDDGSLATMLARAYDPTFVGRPGLTTLFTYANIARQLEVRGLRTPDIAFADNDRVSEWVDGIDGLYVDDVLLDRALQSELWDMVGFRPAEITQTFTIGDPPQIAHIYRGAFDGENVRLALASAGYEVVPTGNGLVLSISEEGKYSSDNPIQRLVVAAFNNIAVVHDAYVIASPYLVNVESALAIFGGNRGTLANNGAVETLVSSVAEELVSATILDGSILSTANKPDLGALGASTSTPAQTIPPASHALFGLTAGSMPSRYTDADDPLHGDNDDTAPRSVFVVALHLGSEAEAVAAVPVIEGRLAIGQSAVTGEPYATFFGDWEVAAVPGTPVVKVRIGGERVGRRWLRIVLSGDLVFVYTM